VRVWITVSDARLLLICGLPGAGKTTLARQFAAGRSALRLTQDEWLIALGSSPWDVSTREKVDHELRRLAQEVLRLGLSVVLDFGLWTRIERDEIRRFPQSSGVSVRRGCQELRMSSELRDVCRGLGVSLGDFVEMFEARLDEPTARSESLR
jgi:AAA domain